MAADPTNAPAALTFLATNKDAFEAIESVFTVAGLILAGVWTWMLFVRRRERYPRATITHQVDWWDVDDHHRLVRVRLSVANLSDVLLCLSKGLTWVQQMKPWPRELLTHNDGKPFEPTEKTSQYPWPLLTEHKFAFEGQMEVEPKETDEVIIDFIITKACTQALVYSHVENASKPGRNLGWLASTVIDFSKPKEQIEKNEPAKQER